MLESEEILNIDTVEALQLLECPVCMEILYSPVFQCPNGHLICSNCLDQVNICPTCRRAMPLERIRNLAVENLVSIKCPNFKRGCQARLTRRDKADHALKCTYRPVSSSKHPVIVKPVIRVKPVPLLSSVENKMIGTYKFLSGNRDGWIWTNIVYSLNGSLWKREVNKNCEYSFTFGKEVIYQFGVTEFKSTINIENNKLIHQEKQYRDGKFIQNVTRVEEFSDNKMLATVACGQKSFKCVYKKVNG